MVSDNTGSESQDTTSTSTSVQEEQINIKFEDIELTVRNGIFKSGHKPILKRVTGAFNAGELTVIMGPSGAGKSTLMDILAGYTQPTSGKVFVNGRLRDEKWFRRRSCYIMQNDQIQDLLTVEESLQVAADLKLGEHVNTVQKRRRLQEILTALGLDRVRHTQVQFLSGGQKKRLAIGLELVSDPPVMFLDEPTSGLDSAISKHIIYLLQLLARQGRTVIITLHQPSAVLLQMIDRLYVMVNGQCAYMGSVPSLVPYLDTMNLKCPPFHNSVDLLIEILGENAEPHVLASQNGRNMQWISNISAVDSSNDLIGQSNSRTNEEFSFTALPPSKQMETSKILLNLKGTYSTSSWRQFCVLTRRSFLILWRSPTLTRMIIGIHCLTAMCTGILFYNIAEKAQNMRNNYNFLFYSLMFLMFTAFSAVIINFPRELPVVRREHFNRWYNAGAFYAATIVSYLPTQTLCTLTYAVITYWLTGQPLHILRFLGFSWILVHVTYVAVSLGLLVGSIFTIRNAVFFGPLFVMPFTVFSGFFLRIADAPSLFKWIFYVSFLKYGIDGVVLSIFGMERDKLPCTAIYCHYKYPSKFVEDNDCISYSFSVIALTAIGTFVMTIAYIILKIRLRNKW